MPELPEVETFRLFLESKIKHKTILNVQVFFSPVIKKPNDVNLFCRHLIGQKIHNIARKGKYLLFMLDDNVLIVHLRMEGGFEVNTNKNKQPPHCLLEFEMSDHSFLRYVDSRRFGTFHLESKNNYINNPGVAKLGLEPFSNALNAHYLAKKWINRKILIKTALLEQTVIAGIGNIYACEVLYLTKISPYRLVNNVTLQELERLINNLRIIMTKAIQHKGTTISTFYVDDQQGMFYQQLQVYGRKGKKCMVCQTQIHKVKINNRGTYFCPQCQKK